MFQKLHIQLTFLCTFVSGMILVFMSLICLYFSETESKKSHFSDFQINANMLYNHLGSQSVLSRNWLAQFQADTGFEMDIRDNGSKLIFENLSPYTLHEDIFTKARKLAREDYTILEEAITKESVLSTHADFPLNWKGEEYYASVALIPKKSGVLNAAVLLPLTDLNKAIASRRQLFAQVDILGIFLLGLFFWVLTWRMMQPLIKNRQKQTEFIASASHELRSPLTVMLSALSAMQHASPKESAHFSQIIKQEGKRMGRLIDDMLTLSGTDSSHFTIRRTQVELDTLLLSAYEKFEPLANAPVLRLPAAGFSLAWRRYLINLSCGCQTVEPAFLIRRNRLYLTVFTDATRLTRTKNISDWGCALPKRLSICTVEKYGQKTRSEAAQPL